MMGEFRVSSFEFRVSSFEFLEDNAVNEIHKNYGLNNKTDGKQGYGSH